MYVTPITVSFDVASISSPHSRETEREFYPAIREAERGARTAGWNRAVKCAYGWAREDE